MLGKLLLKIREDRGITKNSMSSSLKVTPSYLSHIEKEDRIPSLKVLKNICDVLDVPYQPAIYTYDKKISEEHTDYKVENHIKYDSIPVLNNISGFAKCEPWARSASICLRVNDDSMSPKFNIGTYVYVEFNAPLDNKDFGLFEYNGECIIRKFIIRQKDLVIRAEQDGIDDIILTKDSKFYIIGKILGPVN